MDLISKIIIGFNDEENKDFIQYLGSSRKRRNRMDQKLFSLIQTKVQGRDEILRRLYGKNGKKEIDAYHALRKRLMEQLIDYVTSHEKAINPEIESVRTLLSFGKYLMGVGEVLQGWKYLRKAEQKAMESDNYDLINAVYKIQVEFIHTSGAPKLKQLETKRLRNKIKGDVEERMNLAAAMVRIHLQEVRIQGKNIDLQKTVERAFVKYELSAALAKDVYLLFKFVDMVRSVYLANKDFKSLQPFLEKQYKAIQKAGGLHGAHAHLGAELLYFLAHTYYRNKSFDQATQFVGQLGDVIETLLKRYQDQLLPRYILLKAAVWSYSGNNNMAIDLLNSALEHPVFQRSNKDRMNVYLNLAVYYFQQEQFAEANAILRSFPNTDAWAEKIMGREWMMKRRMIEVCTQVELGYEDLALNSMRSILRKYSDLMLIGKYQRVKNFLSFVKNMIDHPEITRDENFISEMSATFEFLEAESEDLQAMAYYAWLKSRSMKVPYYETLLKMVQ